MTGARRATVASSRLSSPSRQRNCLGICWRDIGQRRVPDPPARMTAFGEVIDFGDVFANTSPFSHETPGNLSPSLRGGPLWTHAPHGQTRHTQPPPPYLHSGRERRTLLRHRPGSTCLPQVPARGRGKVRLFPSWLRAHDESRSSRCNRIRTRRGIGHDALRRVAVCALLQPFQGPDRSLVRRALLVQSYREPALFLRHDALCRIEPRASRDGDEPMRITRGRATFTTRGGRGASGWCPTKSFSALAAR